MSEPRVFLDGRVVLQAGDCREVLRGMEDNSVDSVVTDPPYALVSIAKRFGKEGAAPAKSDGATGVYARASRGFMGCRWDTGATAFDPELWADVCRVMKPGAHAFIFGGDRTYHRLVCAVEDGGLDIRRTFVWAYGSGFPKSLNVSKQIDKSYGFWRGRCGRVIIEEQPSKGAEYERTSIGKPITDAAREWDGWGTDVKPAVELICLARKPISESSIAANILRWGTGAINVGACKIPSGTEHMRGTVRGTDGGALSSIRGKKDFVATDDPLGRWPANLIHDNSEEVLACFPETGASNVGDRSGGCEFFLRGDKRESAVSGFGDSGSAARFFASFPQDDVQRIFYTSKADGDDRLGSRHPTVKPLDLIQYLVRLVTPKNGVCLDLFAGTGTTGEACFREGFRAILIEREPEYIKDIDRRMSLVMEGPVTRAHAGMKAHGRPRDDGPLFGGSEEPPRHARPTGCIRNGADGPFGFDGKDAAE